MVVKIAFLKLAFCLVIQDQAKQHTMKSQRGLMNDFQEAQILLRVLLQWGSDNLRASVQDELSHNGRFRDTNSASSECYHKILVF